MSPQPKPLHQQISANIQALLDQALTDQPYVARQNTNIKFGRANSMPAPDVFVVRRDSWERACHMDEYLSDAPLLVVEIISSANRKLRVEEKGTTLLEPRRSDGVDRVSQKENRRHPPSRSGNCD